jgi:hypothetical protein
MSWFLIINDIAYKKEFQQSLQHSTIYKGKIKKSLQNLELFPYSPVLKIAWKSDSYSLQIKNSKTEIDLGDLPAGLYLFRAGTLIKKIIKK